MDDEDRQRRIPPPPPAEARSRPPWTGPDAADTADAADAGDDTVEGGHGRAGAGAPARRVPHDRVPIQPPSAPAPPGVMQIEEDDPEGPPPPPPLRRRRRRRNIAIGTALAAIVGVPLVLGVIGNTGDATGAGEQDDPPAASDEAGNGSEGLEDDSDGSGDGQGDGSGDGSGDGDPDGDIDRLDSSQFGGTDGVFAELLEDIDDSERAMMDFQDALSGAFAGAGGDDEQLTQTIRDAASTGQAELAQVRDRLVGEVADDGAETVRAIYLDHLDSWAEYMAAIEDDPGILGSEDRTRVYILTINVTADAFARSLEEQLPADADAQVRRYADDILDRGFRGFSEADV